MLISWAVCPENSRLYWVTSTENFDAEESPRFSSSGWSNCTINCKGSQISWGLELDQKVVSIREPPKEFKTFKAVKMSYLSIKNALYRGIVAFFQEGRFLVILATLNVAYPGSVYMKASDRRYFWCPGIDSDIWKTVKEYSLWQATWHNLLKEITFPFGAGGEAEGSR